MEQMKLFKCSCAAEGVQIDVDRGHVSFCIWQIASLGDRNDVGFWQRLKFAWMILRGMPLWSDHMLLSPNVAREMSAELLSIADAAETENMDTKLEEIYKELNKE